MKLEMVHLPVPDLDAALALYRDTLGFDEAWREGDTTVGLQVPDTDVMLMLDVHDDGGPGPMFTVPSVSAFLDRVDDLDVVMGPMEIPDGTLAGFRDPGGNMVYLMDQAGAEAEAEAADPVG